MELKKLTVLCNGQQIRAIPFKLGLNLVLNKRGVGRSGNSVGKSTLSRIIDFLFLGSIDPIYIDDEFGKPNEKIEELFSTTNVEVQLEFTGLDNQIHVAERNLSISPTEREFHIDGEKLSEAAYEEAMQALCFDVRTKRPSVRYIAPKFIRNDNHKMLNTTKFLDLRTSPKDYSEVFLYLFGFQNTGLLTDKREASNLVGRRKRQSTALNAITKEQKPASEIGKYRQLAQNLERDLLHFDYSPEYTDPVARLGDLQVEENSITEFAADIQRRIINIDRTVALLNEKGGNHLIQEVDAIYKFAGVSLEGALRSFEEVLSFHDKLVARKLQYLTEDLPVLRAEQASASESLKEIQAKKQDVFSNLRSTEAITKITDNIKELGDLKVKLGKLEGLLEQQQLSANLLKKAEEDLQKILATISTQMSAVETFVTTFNKHFKRLTQIIHADPYQFSLQFDEDTGICEIDVITKVSNPEGGKKKAEVIAFDMAYICTANELNSPRPRFVFHDSIEDIDQKQIEGIFTLAQKLPGQQIISMLSDKFTQKMYDENESNAILFLSENDMFFKIP